MKLSLALLAAFATFASAASGRKDNLDGYVARLKPDAIFGNELPNAILEMETRIPEHSYEKKKVEFKTPAHIKKRLLQEEPSDYLQGACLQTYQGYKDGKRLHDLTDMLGQETYDMLIEYVLFDFVLNDCQWIQSYWGCVKDGWKYGEKNDNDILKDLETDHGFLITEVTDWMSYWIETEHKQGAQIYEDSIIFWKQAIIGKFLSLKGQTVLVGDLPQAKKQRAKIAANALTAEQISENREKIEMKKKGAKKLNKMERRRLAQDSDECTQVNPVEFFGSRWDRVARFLKKYHSEDMEKKGNGKGNNAKKHSHKKKTSSTRSVDTSVTFVTEVCEGVCVRIGTGFTWNSLTNDASIDFSYGLGTQRRTLSPMTNEPTDASVKLNLALRCQSKEDVDNLEEPANAWDNVLSFGKMVPDADMEYSLLYDANTEKMVGLAYTVGLGFRYDGENIEEDDINFFYLHNGQMATLATGEEDGCTGTGAQNNGGGKGHDDKMLVMVGKAVQHNASSHWGVVLMASILSVIAVLLYKMCHLTGKQLEETQPLLSGAKKSAYAQKDGDEYQLMP